MAINQNEVIYHEMHKEQSINTILYEQFIEVLCLNFTGKYILIDKVSFHKSKIIKEAKEPIESSGNKVLFIPPYSHDFNPIEEVFSKLKTYIRKYINPLNLNKNIINLTDEFTLLSHNFYNYYVHACG